MRGYKEEGTTTTPFDMVVLNDVDRFRLVSDVAERVPDPRTRAPRTSSSGAATSASTTRSTSAQYGEDMDEIQNWRW